MSKKICSHSLGDYKCTRLVSAENSSVCIYHKVSMLDQNLLEQLISNRDGDWQGFKEINNITLKSKVIDFPIKISPNTKIQTMYFSEVMFCDSFIANGCTVTGSVEIIGDVFFHKKVDFTSTEFCQKVVMSGSVEFSSYTIFRDCKWQGIVELHSVRFQIPPDFSNNTFEKPVFIKGGLAKGVNFDGACFNNQLKLLGIQPYKLTVKNVDLPLDVSVGKHTPDSRGNVEKFKEFLFKKVNHWSKEILCLKNKTVIRSQKIFNYVSNFLYINQSHSSSTMSNSISGRIQFREVSFDKPETVLIENVDFSEAEVMGTNFSDVRLINIAWHKTKGINCLYDEIYARKWDAYQTRNFYPKLEYQYRHMRKVLEENKDFQAASDFYIGEMESKIRQLAPLPRIFSITYWYKILSEYGTNPKRALFAFVTLLMIYVFLSAKIEGEFNNFLDRLFSGLSLMTLRASENTMQIKGLHEWLDLFWRIIGPFQIALIALSIRNKVKRN